jgi:hypothetical protein
MSKLLQRLRDAARSGVYRAPDAAAILEATRGSGLDVVTIDASNDVFGSIASALAFPAWFGANWDALEDSLSDLSWRRGDGHVLIFTGYPDGEARRSLLEVLRSSADYWRARGKPFFAVLLDPARKVELPDLYRAA